MEKWSDGIYLLGIYNSNQVGCWLLVHGEEGAIIEMPPYDEEETSPVEACQKAAEELNIKIKYLLCTHNHGDHLSVKILSEMRKTFSDATVYLQKGFKKRLKNKKGIKFFEDDLKLDLCEELLFLVHAPKHSWTDTMVVFRGAVLSGDWELNTLRSVHDGKKSGVPEKDKLESIEKMTNFSQEYNYRVHKVFSSHANDRRENVDFIALMEDTKVDRKLWEE